MTGVEPTSLWVCDIQAPWTLEVAISWQGGWGGEETQETALWGLAEAACTQHTIFLSHLGVKDSKNKTTSVQVSNSGNTPPLPQSLQ